ncbi:MAG: branched chain amino acid aminotransferase, partial [Bacteroidota bacterium]
MNHTLESTIRIQRVETSRRDAVDMDNIPFGREFSDHMFVVRYSDGAWETPEIVPFGPLGFSPAISALNYGQALFEGMKVHMGPSGEALLFRPEENLR